jgi:hypothetical protein
VPRDDGQGAMGSVEVRRCCARARYNLSVIWQTEELNLSSSVCRTDKLKTSINLREFSIVIGVKLR